MGCRSSIYFSCLGDAALATATGAVIGWAAYEVVQKVKEGKQRDGTPGWNGPQNNQFGDAVKAIERKTGKKLTDDQKEKLHDEISGMDYGYHEIVEEGYWLFK